MFRSLLYGFLFFAIPISLLVLLGISIYRYVSAKNQNKLAPRTFSDEEIKKRKTMLIVLSVIIGVLVAIVVGFLALLFVAIAFM